MTPSSIKFPSQFLCPLGISPYAECHGLVFADIDVSTCLCQEKKKTFVSYPPTRFTPNTISAKLSKGQSGKLKVISFLYVAFRANFCHNSSAVKYRSSSCHSLVLR